MFLWPAPVVVSGVPFSLHFSAWESKNRTWYIRKRLWQKVRGTHTHTDTHTQINTSSYFACSNKSSKSSYVISAFCFVLYLSSLLLCRFPWADTACSWALAPEKVNEWAEGSAVWWILRDRRAQMWIPTKTCCSWEPSRQPPPLWSPFWLFSSASAARGKKGRSQESKCLKKSKIDELVEQNWQKNVIGVFRHQEVEAKPEFYQLCRCPLRLCSSSPPSFMCLYFLRTLPLPSFSSTSVFYPPLSAECRGWMLMAAGVRSDEMMFMGHRRRAGVSVAPLSGRVLGRHV